MTVNISRVRVAAMMAVLALAWFGAPPRAQDAEAGRIRILKVEPKVVWMLPDRERGDPVAPRMSKFLDEEPVPSRVQFNITWAPPAGGLDYGCTVLLEYKLAPDGYAGSCRAAVAGPLQGQQHTRLDVALRGRRVSAWRVRLISGTTVLDGQQSKNWKD